MATWETVADGDRRVCAVCGTPIRSYQFRIYPPESYLFERCIGFTWCSGCRVCSGGMVHVPRERVLVDALASLPPEQRESLWRNGIELIEYLERQSHDGGTSPDR